MQAVATGVLRGTGDTHVPMLLHFAAFWVIGIPLCLGLAFGLGLGPQGVWWGYVGRARGRGDHAAAARPVEAGAGHSAAQIDEASEFVVMQA